MENTNRNKETKMTAVPKRQNRGNGKARTKAAIATPARNRMVKNGDVSPKTSMNGLSDELNKQLWGKPSNVSANLPLLFCMQS